jgi:ubiquinone/menaquinone biosynthesis C-methylase UbiE
MYGNIFKSMSGILFITKIGNFAQIKNRMTYKFFIGLFLSIFLTSCVLKDNDNPGGKNNGYALDNNAYFIDNAPDSVVEVEEYLTNTNFDKLVSKYEDPHRVEWQNPDLVLDKLGDLRGKTVADLGAGSGYFTFRMAQTAKEIIAIDIDQRFLSYIEDRKQELPAAQAEKITTRLTVEDDPSLQQGEVDIVLVVNTFHYIKNRGEYFSKVKRSLKNNGFLVIVDFKSSDVPIAPPKELIVTPEVAFGELREAGFREFAIDEKSLQNQYIVIAR